jgi:hypothetical protein
MKAIAIKSFIAEQDQGCSEAAQLHIKMMAVYNVRKNMRSDVNCEWFINTEQYVEFDLRTDLSTYTYLSNEEFVENFRVIEE